MSAGGRQVGPDDALVGTSILSFGMRDTTLSLGGMANVAVEGGGGFVLLYGECGRTTVSSAECKYMRKYLIVHI